MPESTLMIHDIRALAAELETSSRLVRQLLDDLESVGGRDDVSPRVHDIVQQLRDRPLFEHLPTMLLRAHAEIGEALGCLRVSREALQAQIIDKLRSTQGKLDEVNSAAESAATALMDGLDSALAKVDALDAADGPDSKPIRDALREELSTLYNHLQFQDITSQQLQGVAANLSAAEDRLDAVAKLFEHPVPADVLGERAVDGTRLAFNGDASMRNAAERKAEADALVAAAKGRSVA